MLSTRARVIVIAVVLVLAPACHDGRTLDSAPTTTAAAPTTPPAAAAPSTTVAAPVATAPITTTPASTTPPTRTEVGPLRFDPYAGTQPSVRVADEQRSGTLTTPDGRTRTYRTYVPAARRGPGLPLVVALHGGFGSGAQFARSSGIDELAEANGFVVVYPDGVGAAGADAVRTWNGGYCCGPAVTQRVDDVTFIRLLIDMAARDTGSDPSKVAVVGHSNGAILAYRLACELADRIVAIAVQAGSLEVPSCRPSRPVSVLHLHGLADTNLPVPGGRGSGFAGVSFRSLKETLDVVTRAFGCDPTAYPLSTDNRDLQVTAYFCGPRQIRLVLVEGAAHAWMGRPAPAPNQTGAAYTGLDASRAAISFVLGELRG